MKKIRAIIVDDEEAARNVLEQLLIRSQTPIEIVARCKDVPSAVDAIKAHNPDVVFLDVQMPEYSGYEIAGFFDEINFEIIFITAYDQYAIKAFELSAVDYLVKPINRQRLYEALEKLSQKVKQKDAIENYQVLLDTMKDKELGKIVISELGGKQVIKLAEIIAIEAKGSYSQIHLRSGKELLVSKNLKHFESTLPEDSIFFRSHKSWIINMDEIQSYNKSKGEITLNGDVLSKLSKYRAQEFEALNLPTS